MSCNKVDENEILFFSTGCILLTRDLRGIEGLGNGVQASREHGAATYVELVAAEKGETEVRVRKDF